MAALGFSMILPISIQDCVWFGDSKPGAVDRVKSISNLLRPAYCGKCKTNTNKRSVVAPWWLIFVNPLIKKYLWKLTDWLLIFQALLGYPVPRTEMSKCGEHDHSHVYKISHKSNTTFIIYVTINDNLFVIIVVAQITACTNCMYGESCISHPTYMLGWKGTAYHLLSHSTIQ